MNKKLYTSLVLLMSFSLIGIILMQGYWIYSSWQNKEEEFSLAVKRTLREVVDEIQSRELNDYVFTYQMLIDSIGTPDESNFTDVFLFLDEDQSSNLSTFFAYGILEEDYNINLPDNLSNRYDDDIKDYKAVKTTIVNKNIFDRRENRLNASISKLKSVEDIDLFKFEKYKSAFQEYASSLPIHKRTTSREIQILLNNGFNDRNIITPYEFGIYSNGLSTKVKSNNYMEVQSGPKYSIPFLNDELSSVSYNLIVSFPDKQQYVLSSIIGVATLSFMLTLIVVVIATSALYQIIQQKKLSEIKNDFINNISHEFKTPIATINLALDAISSSTKNLNDKSISYLGMIREENSRMLSQVENILRISQLEKSSNPFDMEEIDIHEVIEDAIEHVKLIVESKKGSIDLSLKAVDSNISGNSNHLENIIINILDNAVKYSKENPKIVVSSTNINKDIRLCFEDNGIGMDKNTQKLIFEKFYREQNGDIHNIKGHGLGLSYVKKIIDFHNGKILLESIKGTGTKFYITLKNI
ncbi:HAMP domain-containing histidine kinase [Flavobacteriaceae bacterium]|nr:HAMP domain-containing histidine kinase [Flavobacteriaceae bacterium]MDA9850725.1 HAMP domain-containing histidine kinase [Flavobacteriaceae bacterium]MDC0559718.1 HAMP domain-containing histidine kinase [Flavobacteriaceae bacterium]MDC6473319.1 HAMP domain-containing sensor histidine kinase [Flavobacteriaceae bacterium]